MDFSGATYRPKSFNPGSAMEDIARALITSVVDELDTGNRSVVRFNSEQIIEILP
ncbi:hypothetical protein [Nocardia carnea]|uniref:hypothetical protein n=1 Tax=Nocardia carnea TaxID=37328 RepID=UPI002457E76A|nr:hypothetical protein [Nocardia carnea]